MSHTEESMSKLLNKINHEHFKRTHTRSQRRTLTERNRPRVDETQMLSYSEHVANAHFKQLY